MFKLKNFGTSYGGFSYPDNLDGLNSDSIIYCIGAGEDVSHDIVIAKQLGAKVYIIDPTPRAIEHVNTVKKVFRNEIKPINSKRFGGGDKNYWKILQDNKIDSDNIVLLSCAVDRENSSKKFYLPSNNDYVSCSLVEGMKSNNYITVTTKTLNTIMNEFGHTHIDLLKMDIEGSECDVVDYMFENNITPLYLAIEFDLLLKDSKRVKITIKKIQDNGYIILHSNNREYTFYRKTV